MKKIFLCGCILLFGLAGCKSLKDLSNSVSKPSLSVSDVHITDFNFKEVELTYDVKVKNPNPIALHMLSYDYNLQINDNDFVNGNHDKNLDIASSGTSTFQIPMRVNFDDLYRLFTGLSGRDAADYKLGAHLNFSLPVVGKTSVPLTKKGSLPLLKVPKITVSNLKVESINLSRAKLNLNLKVDNPNGMGVLLNALTYNLNVNGKNWVDGNNSQKLRIGEHDSGRISIPINLNIAQIGGSVLQSLRGSNPMKYDLKGTLNLGATGALFDGLTTKLGFHDGGNVPIAN